jgi:hypothetical protein
MPSLVLIHFTRVVAVSVAGSWAQGMWAHLLPLLGQTQLGNRANNNDNVTPFLREHPSVHCSVNAAQHESTASLSYAFRRAAEVVSRHFERREPWRYDLQVVQAPRKRRRAQRSRTH